MSHIEFSSAESECLCPLSVWTNGSSGCTLSLLYLLLSYTAYIHPTLFDFVLLSLFCSRHLVRPFRLQHFLNRSKSWRLPSRMVYSVFRHFITRTKRCAYAEIKKTAVSFTTPAATPCRHIVIGRPFRLPVVTSRACREGFL